MQVLFQGLIFLAICRQKHRNLHLIIFRALLNCRVFPQIFYGERLEVCLTAILHLIVIFLLLVFAFKILMLLAGKSIAACALWFG